MTITYHEALIQGSEEWVAARVGLLTASEMHFIVAPPPPIETRIKKDGEPYKQREWNPVASNDKERAHLWELLAQRITRYVEPRYISDDMLRGTADEIEARALYAATYAPIAEVGFVTNDRWGFTIGYSPDALVGEDGLIECKSRRQRFQTETIATVAMPADYLMQVQTGLLVTERAWCDFVSYSGGLPMVTIRVFPDQVIHEAIVAAAAAFEVRLAEVWAAYRAVMRSDARLLPTERRIEQEMHL